MTAGELLETIETLCGIIEQCVAVISDEKKAEAMLAAMRKAIGEED